jgi:hypothetical protein
MHHVLYQQKIFLAEAQGTQGLGVGRRLVMVVVPVVVMVEVKETVVVGSGSGSEVIELLYVSHVSASSLSIHAPPNSVHRLGQKNRGGTSCDCRGRVSSCLPPRARAFGLNFSLQKQCRREAKSRDRVSDDCLESRDHQCSWTRKRRSKANRVGCSQRSRHQDDLPNLLKSTALQISTIQDFANLHINIRRCFACGH